MGRIRRLTIYSNKIKTSKKILVYSDLHLGFKNRSNINEVFLRPELSPKLFDYILIPGDLVHTGKILENPNTRDEIIKKLATLTGNTKTYVSLGNHDQYERYGFESWSAYCKEAALSSYNQLPNMKVLDINQKISFDDIEFSAFNNSVYYYLEHHESPDYFSIEYESIGNKMQFSKDCFSILLTHDPKSIYRLSTQSESSYIPNTDLVVSGHMHNGLTPNFLQSKLNGRGILSPDYTLFPETAYGIKTIDETIFLINGAVSSFVEIPILNKLFGINCTIVDLKPAENAKKLTYTYK